MKSVVVSGESLRSRQRVCNRVLTPAVSRDLAGNGVDWERDCVISVFSRV